MERDGKVEDKDGMQNLVVSDRKGLQPLPHFQQ